MTIVKQHPVLESRNNHPITSVLDQIFQNSGNAYRRAMGFMPAVDLFETSESYVLEAALPGLKKEEILVEFQDGVLTIAGERNLPEERKELKHYRVENVYGKFKRTFQLPDHVDGGAISAQFENGLLLVTVPKVEEKVIKRQIAIQ